MARFEDAIMYVLANEGAFSNHPADPGGATFWGISLRFLKSQGEEWDLDDDGDIDVADVRSLTVADAKLLYRSNFWDRLQLDLVADQAVATRIFDMAVNMGCPAAVKILQRAANDFSLELNGDEDLPELLEVDGVLGLKTRSMTNILAMIDRSGLMAALRKAHEQFYLDLVERKPNLEVFLRGWLNRARM